MKASPVRVTAINDGTDDIVIELRVTHAYLLSRFNVTDPTHRTKFLNKLLFALRTRFTDIARIEISKWFRKDGF